MTTNGLQMPQSSRKKCSRPSFDILKYQSYHTAESKMLYIFHVDTGTTYTFDIQLAVQESLAELRDAIERRCGIKPSDQVLLMNGGDTLGPQSRICSFSAGTDTNPIYLFSKFSILNQVPPTMLTNTTKEDPNEGLIDQLKASKEMEATFKTLVARADLAQKCYEIAREQASTCHRLVHDQHFQHQGWSAVIANLEDIIQPFQNYASYQFDKFAVYLSDRHYFVEMMNRFYKDLGILAKIPVLPILLEGRESTFCAKVTPSPDPQIQEIAECAREDGIFTWLTTQDNPTTLEAVADHCTRGLQGLNDQAVKVLMNEVNELIEIAKKEEMREIKGLGDRLSTLETLIGRTKVLVQSQGDLAQGFLQNQTRAINLGDPSVLPVICLSHQSQIENMVRNYEQLRDIRERCTAAKEELSFNIYHRLKWVLFVQNRVKDLETQLDMLGGNLQRLMRNLDLLEQVHIGPDMYMEAIGEVVRRRTFSQAFIAWTTELARQLFKVHSDEIARRRDFHRKFDGHFLSPLFPGLQDIPPPFATQPPPIFDNGLPQLTVHHLEFLKEQLPELANRIPEPDMDGIKRFFCLKRLTRGIIDSPKRTNNIPMTVDTQSKEERDDTTTTTTTTTIVANRVGFESETDTEEFEKIGQGGGDSKVVVVGSSFDEAKQNAVQKQLEENLGNTRSEVEHLRGTLRKMKITTSATIAHFREELKYLREQVTENKPDLTAVSGAVEHALKLYEHHYRLFNGRERELIEAYKRQRASNDTLLASRDQEISNLYQAVQEAETQLADRDLLINTMRQQLNNENAEMRSLQTRFQQQLDDALEQARLDKESAINEINQARQMETEALNASLAQCQSHISELEESLKKAAAEQQRAVKEATDKVQMEYKSELDTIRTRFKMVAMATSTMERSPSDSSLEKIEVEKLEEEKQRLENKMLAERLILKQRENQIQELEAERNGLRHELNESRLKMSKSSSSSSPGLEDTLQTLLSGDKDDIKVSETKKVRLSDDSTMNPEKLARRLEMMALDNKRLMTELYIIRASKGSADTRVEALEADKLRLEIELCKERSRRGGGGSRLVADSEVYGSVSELASTSTYASADSTPKDMNLSVAIVPESSSQDISASCSESNVSRFGYDMSRMIPHYRNLVTKHFQHIIEQRPVTWSSCKPGETILVAWEASRSRHIIVQDTKTIHVLNPDGIANELGLNPDGTPKATLIISTVLDKQYCQAKKQENRYHVDQGVKFYRVRVKPIASVP